MRPIPLTVSALLFLAACGPVNQGTQEPIGPTLEPPAVGEGFQFAMDYTVPAHSEAWVCAVYPIPIEELSAVHSVEYEQNPGMHHMTISTTGFDAPEVDYGMRNCQGLYDEMMDNIIAVFGSQGSDHDVMTLPDGVAANLPPNLDIVHEIHYVNVSDEPVDLFSRVNAYVIPQEEVTDGIWGGQVRDENIHIPAASTHTEWSRCVMNRDVEVLFLASHTHGLGVEFTVAPFDGVETGDVFYRNDDLHEPKIVQYEPPMVVPEGAGFEFQCTWDNPGSEPVIYGVTAEDEMCNLALVHTPFDPLASCVVVETSDGVLWEG
ncbi:MAG: hypothetical protein VX498_02500 [Myxococcota bacterium]|nr:hypothetical protein [Myxococcota bacterium]